MVAEFRTRMVGVVDMRTTANMGRIRRYIRTHGLKPPRISRHPDQSGCHPIYGLVRVCFDFEDPDDAFAFRLIGGVEVED